MNIWGPQHGQQLKIACGVPGAPYNPTVTKEDYNGTCNLMQ